MSGVDILSGLAFSKIESRSLPSTVIGLSTGRHCGAETIDSKLTEETETVEAELFSELRDRGVLSSGGEIVEQVITGAVTTTSCGEKTKNTCYLLLYRAVGMFQSAASVK